MAGEFSVFKCSSCGWKNYKPFISCRICGEKIQEEFEMPKKGSLYSFTRIHFPPDGWSREIPYVVGVVSIPVEEGAVLLTGIYNGDAPLEIGAEVRIGVTDGQLSFQLAK